MSWNCMHSTQTDEVQFTYEGENPRDASEVKEVLVNLAGSTIAHSGRFLYVSVPYPRLQDALKELADANFDVPEE